MPGMEATQIPNKRLEQQNRKPTANTGLFFMKEVKFLIMRDNENCELTISLRTTYPNVRDNAAYNKVRFKVLFQDNSFFVKMAENGDHFL